jgi:serine beta-lactamase-like protein LACTB
MSAAATPLHPQPQSAPSVTQSEPSQRWSRAVDRARQIMRAGLAEQNLPGLSVAVGVGGDIVWAEGFGWADIEKRVPVRPDTRFRIGTASTVLTSAAVGVLLEKDRLTSRPSRWPVSQRRRSATTASRWAGWWCR